MKFVNPNVEYWHEPTNWQQIARVGRLCYKSQPKEPDANLTEEEKSAFREENAHKLCSRFWESGHKSMFRHGTEYFFFPDNTIPEVALALKDFGHSPYIAFVMKDNHVWASTNMQFSIESGLGAELSPYIVDEEIFIAKAKEYKSNEALMLLRMTLVVTTQISTSRELNRTSPNAIAEQSTRYCNLEKKGGVQIAKPHWFVLGSRWQRFLYLAACKFASWAYLRLLKSGMKPQDARGVLPLDTYTVVAYTYNIKEWKHIIDLRFYETTGKAHPNAKTVAFDMYDLIQERMSNVIPDFEI